MTSESPILTSACITLIGVAAAQDLGAAERRFQEGQLGVRVGDHEIRRDSVVRVFYVAMTLSSQTTDSLDCRNLTWFWNSVRDA